MTWMIMRSSSGGLREAPAGQGPCPAPGPSNTIYYFQYLLLLPLPTAVFFLLEIYHVHVLNNTKITSAFYFFWKVFILDPTDYLHCSALHHMGHLQCWANNMRTFHMFN